MPAEITHVQPGSLAERLGLKEGDELVSIGGEEIIDQIDYQSLTAHSAFDMIIRSPEGAERKVHVHKHDWEPLGITLDQSIVSSPRPCQNQCIFCFIHQMPPGMRPSLYVKDDDWRLSLMMGNYITMTNITDAEFDRIIRRRVSPLYISVHTTDAAVRCAMMKNPKAALLLERLHLLKKAGLRFHCQVVLCPGWNDGEQLQKTVHDLMAFHPLACSVALVPVGLTRFREYLPAIRPYTAEMASELLEQTEKLQEECLQKLHTRFVFPSDEFFCLSGRPIPPDDYYEDYPQIENGVGMLRMFETDLEFAVEDEPCSSGSARRFVIACGTSVAPYMRSWCRRFAPPGTEVEVRPILNRFFGETITVTGLITGRDLVEQLRGVECDQLLLSRSMLRSEGDRFLDDVLLEEVQKELSVPVRVVENTGEDFWHALCGREE